MAGMGVDAIRMVMACINIVGIVVANMDVAPAGKGITSFAWKRVSR
jgi:hypothetical protein